MSIFSPDHELHIEMNFRAVKSEKYNGWTASPILETPSLRYGTVSAGPDRAAAIRNAQVKFLREIIDQIESLDTEKQAKLDSQEWPKWTLLANLTVEGRWLGKGWWFFDERDEATAFRAHLENSTVGAVVGTIRPFHRNSDRHHMGGCQGMVAPSSAPLDKKTDL